MFEAIAALVLFHPELALIPMVVGTLLPALYASMALRLDRFVAGLVASVIVFVATYVGWTALLASVEAVGLATPGSGIVLLGALGLLGLGVLLAFASYGRLLYSWAGEDERLNRET